MKTRVKKVYLLVLVASCGTVLSQSAPTHDETSEESWLGVGLQAGMFAQMATHALNQYFDKAKAGALALKKAAGKTLTAAEEEFLSTAERIAQATKGVGSGVVEEGKGVVGKLGSLVSQAKSKIVSAFDSIKIPWFSGEVKQEVINGANMAAEKAAQVAGENGAAAVAEVATPGVLARILAGLSEYTGLAVGTVSTGGTILAGIVIFSAAQTLAEAAARMLEQAQQKAASDNPEDQAQAVQLAQGAQALSNEADREMAKLSKDAVDSTGARAVRLGAEESEQEVAETKTALT